MVDETMRFEAAFFESVRVLTMRLTNTGVDKKISLPEMNARINELLKQSIKSDGVINLFSDVKEEFSLFDSKFLQEVANMKEKNLADLNNSRKRERKRLLCSRFLLSPFRTR